MPIELTATTEPGARLVADRRAARRGASRPARPQHDREAATRSTASTRSRRAGYFAAPVPEELGGLGVTSVHDLVVASSRLARGDASVAIGVNMHLVVVLNMARRWRVARRGRQRAPRATAFGALAERDRPRRRRDGRRDQRARAGPHAARARRATRTDAGWRDRRPQDLLHDVAGRDGALRRASPTPTTTASSATATRACRPTRAGVDDPRRLGRARHARLGQPLGHVRRRRAARSRRCAAASPPASPVPYMERNLPAGLFHAVRVARHRRGGARGRRSRGVNGGARRRPRARCSLAENAIDLAARAAALARAPR